MRVLVACEYSGTVRDAFRLYGHDAISCDLLPTESPGPHVQGDVLELLKDYWDMIIAHPPCTYLCNSGVRWLHEVPSRWQQMREGAGFFKRFIEAKCRHLCIENPVPHKYALAEIGVPYTQTIQPWQFGHGETKRTCLWLRNLPPLEPTNVVEGRRAVVHKMPPSKDRGKLRSRFYAGIAEAMADQWG